MQCSCANITVANVNNCTTDTDIDNRESNTRSAKLHVFLLLILIYTLISPTAFFPGE